MLTMVPQHLNVFRLVGLPLLALALLAGAGCAAEEEATPTAEQRKSVSIKARRSMVEADQAFRRGAYHVTLAKADSAAKEAPGLSDPHFLRARALTEMKRFGEARAAYEKVLSLDPGYEGVWLNLANNSFRQNRYREALKRYRKEMERHPAADLWTKIGYTYDALGMPDSTLWAYEQALAMDSSQAPAYMEISNVYDSRGKIEKALDYSRQALQLDSSNTAYRYAVGAQLRRAGQTEQAVEHLEAVARERPHHHGAHYNLGQALTRLGRASEAQPHLARADSLGELLGELKGLKVRTENKPRQPMAWIRLAGMQRRLGRLEEATQSLKVALSLTPGDLRLQTNLATLYMQSGNAWEAIRRYRAVLQQDPTFADAWLNLGVAYANAGQNAAARRAWKKTLEHQPGDPAARKYLATLPNSPRRKKP